MVFVSHGQEMALADHPSSALVDATQDLDDAWIPRSEIQRAEAATVLICGSYQLNRARSHPLLAELPDLIHLPARVSRQAPLSAVVPLLGDELDERNPGSDAIVSSLLDTMLLYIVRTWYKERAPNATTGWAAALSDPAVSTALHHLHRDPTHPWTVEELGTRAGLSRAAFPRRESHRRGVTRQQSAPALKDHVEPWATGRREAQAQGCGEVGTCRVRPAGPDRGYRVTDDVHA